jgi:catechol 2,3-dioxygenase-like lactoylglutathione lyase family enzyme
MDGQSGAALPTTPRPVAPRQDHPDRPARPLAGRGPVRTTGPPTTTPALVQRHQPSATAPVGLLTTGWSSRSCCTARSRHYASLINATLNCHASNVATFASLVLLASDVDAAARFYRALGLPLEDEDHGEGPVHLPAELGGVHFALYPAAAPGRAPDRRSGGSSFPGVYVESLDDVLREVQALDAPVLTGHEVMPWGCRFVRRLLTHRHHRGAVCETLPPDGQVSGHRPRMDALTAVDPGA